MLNQQYGSPFQHEQFHNYQQKKGFLYLSVNIFKNTFFPGEDLVKVMVKSNFTLVIFGINNLVLN